MFAVMNYRTLWRLFCHSVRHEKAVVILLKGGKQTLISPTNTGVDEGKETNMLDKLALICKQFFLRTQFLHTLITPKNLNYHQHTFAQTN